MESNAAAIGSPLLRLLPSIDELLGTETARTIAAETGSRRVTSLAREANEALRNELLGSDEDTPQTRESLLAKAADRMKTAWAEQNSGALRRVINATGVVIHTNLGRAPLSEAAKKALVDVASGYCTLEYDVMSGNRGKRGSHAESHIAELTGAESAIIVNNCAAAAFLILNVFASGREVIISRGELVEIGGDFRIPDVLAQSGAVLREVGTTNRTKIADYERAFTENTAMILRVHPSNYRIVGFTERPSLADLAKLAHGKDAILYEDAGSGALIDLTELGITDEPLISSSISQGADIVSFSGDKLLGGSQAGIIVGRRDLINRIRKNPLYRALRADKLTYAVLEATLESYVRETALSDVPVLRMLSATQEELAARARKFADKFSKRSDQSGISIELIEANSVVGGGAAPSVNPKTTVLALNHKTKSATVLEEELRGALVPVISRIVEDRVFIDLRTVSESEEAELLEILLSCG